MKEKLKIIFRQATLDDVDGLVTLEKEVWGVNGANYNQLESRIKIFPQGNIIAVCDQQVVGYISFEYVDNVVDSRDFTWDDITDYGSIIKSHKVNGEYIYGINISVHHLMNGYDLFFILGLEIWINGILNNKKGVFLGSRIPYFARYKKSNPLIDVNDYVDLKRNGKYLDSELRLYERDGLKPVKVLPGYFPDPDSLNYGVLVYRNNPFYNWPLKFFWIYIIRKMPSIRSTFAVKKK
ncbi:MAG: hypothetical protein WCK37_03730 [Candidatus Falkowbacteria bacterium]